MLLSTALFVFFSRTTCSGCSHIISIIYTYRIIRISLFIKPGNIYIICIYDITCNISISLTWTYYGHCPHPFTWYEYIIFLFFIKIYNHIDFIFISSRNIIFFCKLVEKLRKKENPVWELESFRIIVSIRIFVVIIHIICQHRYANQKWRT